MRYSVPRRFDLVTLLVVAAAYSLLFTGMTALNFGISAFLYLAGLVTFVAVTQSLFASREGSYQLGFLFRNDPRQISVLAGILFYVVFVRWEYGASYFWQGILSGASLEYLAVSFFSLLAILIPGTLMGYFSGVLVGGVFLVADYLRGLLRLLHVNRAVDHQDDVESPFDD